MGGFKAIKLRPGAKRRGNGMIPTRTIEWTSRPNLKLADGTRREQLRHEALFNGLSRLYIPGITADMVKFQLIDAYNPDCPCSLRVKADS